MRLRQRPTDDPTKPAPTLITDRESARVAALASVTTYCGWCNSVIPSSGSTKHKCRVSDEAKRMHAEGARRELAALKVFPVPPCEMCGRVTGPGISHDCVIETAPLPHDVAASAFQKRAAIAALQADLNEISTGKATPPMTTTEHLRNELHLLRHAPGTAGRMLEEELAAERKKDERRSKMPKRKPVSQDFRERTARTLAIRAHETLRHLHSLLPEDQKRSVPATPISDRVLKPRKRVQAVGGREYTTQEIAAFRHARTGQVERITSAPSLQVRR